MDSFETCFSVSDETDVAGFVEADLEVCFSPDACDADSGESGEDEDPGVDWIFLFPAPCEAEAGTFDPFEGRVVTQLKMFYSELARSRGIVLTLVPRRRGVWSGGVRSWRRTGWISSP